MLIWLIDRQRWFRITKTEAKRIIAADLTEYTSNSIQPYLLY